MEYSRKLTIAIPTFNRYSDLRVLLGAIKKQLSNLDYKITSLIHIHVQDNSSNDNTANYLINSLISSEIKNTGALLTYKINSENFGFDKNVSLCIENCLSEYIWIIHFMCDQHLCQLCLKKDVLVGLLKITRSPFSRKNLIY